MPTLTDLEIETLILECVDRLFEETDLKLTLSSINEDGFNILLDDDKWIAYSEIDPLSCILYFNQPVPIMNGDDNFALATIKKKLDRTNGWILSFQDAVRGKYNSSSSINGYISGRKVRQYVLDTRQNIK